MSMRRGSATMSLAPRWRLARRTLMPMTGCCSVVLLPMIKIQRLSWVMSRIELVIAPLPKLVTRPVTVELCQRRAPAYLGEAGRGAKRGQRVFRAAGPGAGLGQAERRGEAGQAQSLGRLQGSGCFREPAQ